MNGKRIDLAAGCLLFGIKRLILCNLFCPAALPAPGVSTVTNNNQKLYKPHGKSNCLSGNYRQSKKLAL